MNYKRNMLLLSVLVAAAMHGALYLAAPHIYLLRADALTRELPERFRVTLRPEAVTVSPPSMNADDGRARPESVRDLLARDEEIIVPEPLPEVIEQPEPVEDRVSDPALERDHDFEPELGALEQIDAAILEISSQHARADIDVPRRLVRPSGHSLIPEGEFPVLRGPDERAGSGNGSGFGGAFGVRLGGESGGTGAGDIGGLAPEDERAAVDAKVLGEDARDPSLPALEVEDFVAREFARRTIEGERNFEVLDEHIDVDVGTYIDPATGEGFFRLSINPRAGADIPRVPKQVTFVLDASKSILQRKLDQAVEGTIDALNMLHPDDRFNIVIFRDTPKYFQQELVPASPGMRAAAAEFLDDLEAQGSTDVYAALRDLIADPKAPGIADIVLLISDGKPTGDALAGRDLINALTSNNTHRRTVYTFGAGKSADRYLLDLLAYRNKGMTYISPRSDTIDEDLPRFFSRIDEPMLVDLQADYGRISDSDVYPREVPDFYRNRPVTVYGRFDPEQQRDVVMRVTGRAGDARKEILFKADLSALNTGDSSIAREWAFEKSYYIIGEICEFGERPAYQAELDRLSRQYGVRTSYTR